MERLNKVRQSLQTPHGRFRHGVIKRVVEQSQLSESAVRNVLCGYGLAATPRMILAVIDAAEIVAAQVEHEMSQI